MTLTLSSKPIHSSPKDQVLRSSLPQFSKRMKLSFLFLFVSIIIHALTLRAARVVEYRIRTHESRCLGRDCACASLVNFFVFHRTFIIETAKVMAMVIYTGVKFIHIGKRDTVVYMLGKETTVSGIPFGKWWLSIWFTIFSFLFNTSLLNNVNCFHTAPSGARRIWRMPAAKPSKNALISQNTKTNATAPHTAPDIHIGHVTIVQPIVYGR